jgi:large subunit ribosomal protein L19
MDRLTSLVESSQLRGNIPDFDVGDTIRVNVKIVEEDRERTQVFEGVVISKKGKGMGRTFTMRRISYGEGVERVFPYNSPLIESIKVVRKGKVRRAKLYYLRTKIGKGTKVDEKREVKLSQTGNVQPATAQT